MEIAISLGFMVLVVILSIVNAVELGKARGVGRMFENRRKKPADSREDESTPDT